MDYFDWDSFCVKTFVNYHNGEAELRMTCDTKCMTVIKTTYKITTSIFRKIERETNMQNEDQFIVINFILKNSINQRQKVCFLNSSITTYRAII